MKCPVCELEISSGEEECPQCNADLTCFTVLDSIRDTSADERRGRKKRGLRKYVTILAVSILFILSLFFQFYRLNLLNSELESRFSKLSGTITRKMDVLSGELKKSKVITPKTVNRVLKKDPEKIKAPARAEPDFFIYNAKNTDTLWSIAADFYKNGIFYPVILEMNPGLDLFKIRDGVKIRILKRMDEVKKVYRTVVIKKDSSFFYKYKILRGDTVETLAARFYKEKNGTELLGRLNPVSNFKIGDRIYILLK